jgi:hypothetical protein
LAMDAARRDVACVVCPPIISISISIPIPCHGEQRRISHEGRPSVQKHTHRKTHTGKHKHDVLNLVVSDINIVFANRSDPSASHPTCLLHSKHISKSWQPTSTIFLTHVNGKT